MPPANPAVVAGIIAVSAAIAAALAIYESPQFRRHAEDVRRRIALALHQLGDNINPRPRYSWPEDVPPQRSSSPVGDENAGVDADEESRRRQRDELMYWNAVRLQKQQEREEREAREAQERQGHKSYEARPEPSRGSSFDDFLKKDDSSSEKGAYVVNTGTDLHTPWTNLVNRRGDGPKAAPETYTAPRDNNPFSDSHRITDDEKSTAMDGMCLGENDDIYSSTTHDKDHQSHAPHAGEADSALIDFSHTVSAAPAAADSAPLRATLERRLADNEFVTATPSHLADDHHRDAFSSIQAWAQGSTSLGSGHEPDNFYSPQPLTPVAPVSEPDIVSVSDEFASVSGGLTPTDSVSLADSGEDVAAELAADREGDDGQNFGVLSESEGMATPASWSEVGSMVSDDDAHHGR